MSKAKDVVGGARSCLSGGQSASDDIKSFSRRRILQASCVFPAFFSGLARIEAAQPVVLVVPFAPGNFTDGLARVVALSMGGKLSQSVVVENRAGASGRIGTENFLRTARLDGYSVLVGTVGTHSVQPLLKPQVRYDPVHDFIPVHALGASPNMLVVPMGKPWKTMADMVDEAKRRPGQLTFGSAGIGTSLHLCGELLQMETGIRLTHVPYVSSAQAMTDVIAGRIDLMFDFPYAMSQVRAGRVKALAVTSTERVAIAAEVPTTAEAGFASVRLTSWVGLFVPAKTPSAIVTQLAQATEAALADPKVGEFVAQSGSAVWEDMGPDKFRAFLAEDVVRMRKLLESAGVAASKGS